MLRKTQIAATFALLTVLSSGTWISAQNQNAQITAPSHYRVKQILGTKVNIDGNTSICTVEDVVFDDDGYIDYLIVANQGKLVTVPWEAAKFNFEKRTTMVQIAPEKFQQIPTYTTDEYPTFSSPSYRTQTYQYYGLTPGQTRRLNRKQP